MSIEPHASARRVFWIVDNGSSHRGQAAVDRMQEAWPAARPFNWKYTKKDLNALLARITAHEPDFLPAAA
jgi:hypothetical protein